jgi:DNA-binding response OmpR family regulator
MDDEFFMREALALAREAVALKPALAIVLMSGFSDQLDRAHGINARRFTAISKPFTLDQIKSAVRAILA